MPVFLLQLNFYLIPLLECSWHRNMKQFAQGHLGKQHSFFCQPHITKCKFSQVTGDVKQQEGGLEMDNRC